MTERGAFIPALGAVVGGGYVAEYVIRRARELGLMRAAARGCNRLWTVDEVAAVVLSLVVYNMGGLARRAVEQRIFDDAFWRQAVLEGFAQALAFGWEIHFDHEAETGLGVTTIMRAEYVRQLGALVDDWGRLAEAREATAGPRLVRGAA